MRQAVGFVIGVLAVAGVLAAQQQVATVNSTAPFQLRSAGVTTGQGVPSFPVMPGDDVKAGSAATALTFQDGSTVTLNPGAEVTVSLTSTKPTVTVLAGSISYAFTSANSVELIVNGKHRKTTELAGVFGANGAVAAGAPGKLAGSTIAIIVIASAAAIGVGVGVGIAVSGPAAASHQ